MFVLTEKRKRQRIEDGENRRRVSKDPAQTSSEAPADFYLNKSTCLESFYLCADLPKVV